MSLTKGSKLDETLDDLISNIERLTDPKALLREILKWEGVSSHAQLFSFRAMRRLRELGWKIPKYARDSQSEERRGIIKELLSKEYPDACKKTLNVYVSNFNKYLRMEDEEFKTLDRVTITHSRGRFGLMALNEVEIPVSLAAAAQLAEKERCDESEDEVEGGSDDVKEDTDDDDDANEDEVNEDGLASDAADEVVGSVAPRRSLRVPARRAEQESAAETDSSSAAARMHVRRPARHAVQNDFMDERPSKRVVLDGSLMFNDLLHTTQWVSKFKQHAGAWIHTCKIAQFNI
jgi:hypothetical protein